MPVGKLQRVLRWEGPAGATFRLSRREVSSRYETSTDKAAALGRLFSKLYESFYIGVL